MFEFAEGRHGPLSSLRCRLRRCRRGIGLPALSGHCRHASDGRPLRAAQRRAGQGHRPGAVRRRPRRCPGCCYGATVRSPVARGYPPRDPLRAGHPLGRSSRSSRPTTFPARNRVALDPRRPALPRGDRRQPPGRADRAARTSRSRTLLEEARRASTIDIEPLPPVFTIDESLAGREIDLGRATTSSSSTSCRKRRRRRRIARCRASSSKASTRPARRSSSTSSRTACSRSPMPRTAITVWGSMQCPYYIHKALAALFGLPREKIRVVQMETGGGFGGKEEYPSIIAGHAALLAWKSGRPVKLHLRPRRRHGGDDQAPPVADAASHGGRRGTAGCSRWTSTSRSTAAPTARCRPSCCRAAPSTRPARTSARTSGSAAARSRRTRRRTARSAASARRRASSRSSGTWTGSPPPRACTPDEFRRRNFIQPGQTSAVGQVMREPVDMAGAARSRAGAVAAITRSARGSRATIRRSPREEGHRLRDVHARRGLHRIGRSAPRVGRGGRSRA